MTDGATRCGAAARAISFATLALAFPLSLAAAAGPSATAASPGGGAALPAEVSDFRRIRLPKQNVDLELWQQDGRRFYAIDVDGGVAETVREADYRLHLAQRTFDPLADGEAAAQPPLDERLAATADGRVHLVQFWTQPLPAFRDAVAQLGGAVRVYVANYAYVVEMDEAVGEQVEQLAFVRAVEPYHPAYRLESFLVDALQQPGPIGAGAYNILVFEKGPAQKNAVVQRIEALGGVIQKSDAGARLVEAILTPDQLIAVAHFDEVQFIDRWSPPEEDMDIARQLSGSEFLYDTLGLAGAGVRAEVMDGGILQSHNDFDPPPIIHGGTPPTSSHGTKTYGVNFGDGDSCSRGVMPDATGIFASYSGMSGSRYNHTGELVNPGGAYRAVYQSNSWGSWRTPDYSTVSAEMDQMLFDHDILIFQSQSNAGDQDSRPEAWAKNIMAVGGVKHQNTLATSDDHWSHGASIGPASDGRIKPDLAHFYDSVATTSSGSAFDCTGGFSGTSAATPITAGHGGVFFELWHLGIFGNEPASTVFDSRPHMTLAKAMLICTADQWDFTGLSHDLGRMHQGWGRVNVRNMYEAREKIFWIDETEVLGALESAVYELPVLPGEEALRAVMTYADTPGNPAVQWQHRVNDLTLKATAPDGTEYWGNVGLEISRWSKDGGGPDDKNTVESIFIESPAPGVWQIEVIADEINEDGHVETVQMDADFALVVTGVQAPGGCLADIDGTGDVGFSDLLAVLNAWGPCEPCAEDLDGSGDVGFGDLLLVLSTWGACP